MITPRSRSTAVESKVTPPAQSASTVNARSTMLAVSVGSESM